MSIHLRDLLIPFRHKCGMSIRYRGFALVFAIRKDLDFDFVGRETGRHEHVLHAASFDIIGREQPKSLLAVGARGREYGTLLLRALGRMNETRCPAWRPFRLAQWPEKRRDVSHRAFQHNCKRLRPLFEWDRVDSSSSRGLDVYRQAM